MVETATEEPILPAHTILDIYPNPATLSATVLFSIPNAMPVELEVFDALGRRVIGQTLQGVGQQRWDFETTSLSPGLYVLRWRSGQRTEHRTFIVTR